ncbi:MAG: acetyl-CoA hydrolase/transferase family protein [Desulfobacteraceae bacterium]|nr:acetyl-CoA hydrolase/transferase family protein [Desulfobacteraceae bacterium]
MGEIAGKPKKVSVSEAISHIRPGDHLVIGGMAAEPQDLVKELVEQRDRLHDITIYTSFPIHKPLYGGKAVRGSFFIKTFSVGSLREAIGRNQASYLPCHFSEIAALFSNGTLPLDIALIQVSPPDKDGYCSFGVSIEYYPEVVAAARLVIAEMNAKMPRTFGDSLIHESSFDFVVETERPLPEYKVSPPGEVERAIAELCAQLIPDGAVLQFGPGRVHSAILGGLLQKKDLGIHSGLISDSVLEMVREGAITGKTKTVDKGKIVCTSAIGSQMLYDFINENPVVEFYPASYTHNISVLKELKGFISLNVALQVDLLGQVNSETVDGSLVNGVGGMMDFIRGARASGGGKVIFCFPSTVKGREVSRIVPILSSGSPVTATRADMDYFVTEFGVAQLSGRTARERAEAICDIAHPDFREELRSSMDESF